NEVKTARFTPDGKTVFVRRTLGQVVEQWDAATGQSRGPALPVSALREIPFSPDGRLTLAEGGGTVWLSDAATGERIGAPLSGGRLESAAFHPDGRAVLTGGFDGSARLWKVPAPVRGTPEQIRLWVQVITGLELEPGGAARALDPPTWEDCRQRLRMSGGPPLPSPG